MILVFVTNERFGEVSDLVFNDKVGYRNPNYFRSNEKPEDCDGVYIHGNFPLVEKAYKDKLITDDKTSEDYTIAELRKMKPDMDEDEWESFVDGDERKSIDSI